LEEPVIPAFLCWLVPVALGLLALQAPEAFDTPDPFDEDVRTGPAVGDPIPPFRAVDQDGRSLDFDAIKGPHGAVLLFFRSADW
jgi:cytochrome oxidase Cu insertion factor (SCO1/SenC/PrrC family)